MDWPARINNLVIWGSLNLSYMMMYIDSKEKWQLVFLGFFAIAFLMSLFTNFMAL